MRPPTGQFMMGQAAEAPRPMTSVKGAGYTSAGRKGNNVFDPFNQGGDLGPAAPLQQRSDDSPAFKALELEKGVHTLIEESAEASVEGDVQLALEKAKEAGRKERQLCAFREKHDMADQINFDLTYAVCFNLAQQYEANKMYNEAMNTYNLVVKSKQYPQAGRLRANMGNIYFQQKKYPAAIKMYRMAVDQISQTSKEMRYKIMRNIGNAFVKLGQFQDAIQAFEAVMEASPDPHTGSNLLVCYFATGDRDKMKKGFLMLLACERFFVSGEEEQQLENEKKRPGDLLNTDELRLEMKQRKKRALRFVLNGAKLIAPVIERDLETGYDWVIEQLRAPQDSPRGHAPLAGEALSKIAMELEIAKGVSFLKQRNIGKAIEVFKGFEKKDVGMIDHAATNLSFLYFLEGDFKNAEKYANLAVKTDRYNAKALVNKANILFVHGMFEQARELYLEAIGVEADCIEAIYNLGLCNKRLGFLEDALQAFRKLHRIVPKDVQVMYQMADLYDMMSDFENATEWFKVLQVSVPSDPKVLARLGSLYGKQDDESQAFHNFSDSYQCFPASMEVISWLGVWYVKNDLFENAIEFFKRAAEVEPEEVKWKLMVASCYRRMNQLHQALNLYKDIHKEDPDNVECLRYLCNICREMDDPDYEMYAKLLGKAERNMPPPEPVYGGGGEDSGGPLYNDERPSSSSGGVDNSNYGNNGYNQSSPQHQNQHRPAPSSKRASFKLEDNEEIPDAVRPEVGLDESFHQPIGEKEYQKLRKKDEVEDDWGEDEVDLPGLD